MKKFYIAVLAGIILLAGGTFFRGYSKDNEYFKIVENMGYKDVEKAPSEIAEIAIPAEFDAVYSRYNALLMEGGFDLSAYKGKRCKRYTYNIPSLNARANILIYNGKIIGGDISGITIDGIMLPIKKEYLYAN